MLFFAIRFQEKERGNARMANCAPFFAPPRLGEKNFRLVLMRIFVSKENAAALAQKKLSGLVPDSP